MKERIFFEGGIFEEEPLLMFDNDPSMSNKTSYYGLRKYGPYDKIKSESIKIALIYPSNVKQDVLKLIDDLNKGTNGFEGGYSRYFRCSLKIVAEKEMQSENIKDYERAALDITNTYDIREIDLVMIYIPKTEKWVFNTPYYRCKTILATKGFVSQMITRKLFDNLYWSYFNFASALYAKAGYIPWVLRSKYDVDLVIGVSYSSINSKEQLSASTKFVGYVNLFDRYGKWMFMDGTPMLYSKDKMPELLKDIINSSIEKYIAMRNVKPSKIMLHYYKKFNKKEREIIFSEISKKFGDVKIILCSIDDSHNYKLFDKRTQDGSFPRGGYVKLYDNCFLLDTTGFSPYSKKKMGTPKLLMIKIHSNFKRSEDEDLSILYYILGLTKLDWGTVTPPFVREPLSLQYSKALAYLAAAMNEDQWTDLSRTNGANNIISRKPWFI